MNSTEMTVKEWLQGMAKSTTSTESDDKRMQTLIRRCGFPKCITTCGIVYLEGYGESLDIHTMAREILSRANKPEVK